MNITSSNHNRKVKTSKNTLLNPNKKNMKEYNNNSNNTNEHKHKTNQTCRNVNNNLSIATLNVRSLKDEARLIELENALENTKIDVLGLCEVKRIGEKIIKRKSGYIFYHFGVTSGMRGIGFVVNNNLEKQILEFKGFSDRIAILKIAFKKDSTLTLVQVYAPTAEANEELCDEFYNLINNVLEENPINRNNKTIIMGDFNSQVGRRAEEDRRIMGPYGYGHRNERGERLIQFCQENNFKIINSFYKKRKGKKWTWLAPNGIYKNEIDFILSPHLNLISKFEVVNNFTFYTDHRLIKIEVPINIIIKRPNPDWNKDTIFNFQNIQTDVLTRFEKDIKEINFTDKKEIQTQYDNFEKNLSMLQSDSLIKSKSIPKWTEHTKKLIKERNKSKTERNSIKNRIEHNILCKLVKYHIKKDLKDYIDNIIKLLIEPHTSIKKIKKNISSDKSMIPFLMDKDKKAQYDRLIINKIITKYYEKLYNKSESSIEIEDQNMSNQNMPEFLEDEIVKIIKNLKSEKMPGLDGIKNEILKFSIESIKKPLTSLFNNILSTQIIPSQWKYSNIIIIFKKGDPHDIKNYRPITLTSNIGKMFMKLLNNRLEKILDEAQPPEQAGFRRGYSTCEHLHSINIIIEKAKEYKFDIYLAFIDFEKAFDSVHQEYIFQALKSQGVDPTYTKLIKNIYKGSQARIVLEEPGQFFPVKRGVRQGDPLSPALFNCALEEMFRNLNWDNKGLRVNGRNLNNLRFADDIVLIATSLDDMITMIKDLSKASENIGLRINNNKSFILTNAIQKDIEYEANKPPIVCKENIIYLGQKLSFNEKTKHEVSRRIGLAWNKFWSLKFILKNKQIKLDTKIKTLKTCVLPTLLYGSQTWSSTELTVQKLEIAQRNMIRSILGYRKIDRHKIEDLYKITKMGNINTDLRKIKWRWAGHIARMTNERWAKILTEWCPLDRKRSRGRQTTKKMD